VALPFDAVLVVAFGGPQGLDDIRPFLGNVLRGRRVTPERVEEVAHHYERFDGVSPLTALTLQQVSGLRARLSQRGVELPVYVGMRNWHPFLKDTLADMSRDGIRRAVGFIAAAHRSYSSCTQYRENVAEARTELAAAGLDDVGIVYVGDWHTSHGFVEANAAHVRTAFSRLPAQVRDRARLIFTAHSIPVSMAERFPYREQLLASARLIADGVFGESAGPIGRRYDLVYQSRSGRPEDPWLGPDICEYLRAESPKGLEAAVLCPVGFICDHIEVLYDLDVEAADVCRELQMPMARAESVNDDPRFVDAMVEAVVSTIDRYRGGLPLPIVPAPSPTR
jgi:ferrochelatase